MRAAGLSRRAVAGAADASQNIASVALVDQAAVRSQAPAVATGRSTQPARKYATQARTSSTSSDKTESSGTRQLSLKCGILRTKLVANQRYVGSRAYASEAARRIDTEPLHPAEGAQMVSATAPSPPAISTSEASTSQLPFQVQARGLQTLLIDATGRNPGKQRQLSWADQEGGAEEEEQWIQRLEWAANQDPQSRRSTVVTILGDSSEDLAKLSQALLSDPLASDQRPMQALASRTQVARKATSGENVRSIGHDGKPVANSALSNDKDPLAFMAVESRYLAENNVELRELLFDPNAPSMSPALWTELLTSDVIIVQADPPASSDIYRLLQKRNVIFTSSPSRAIPSNARIFEPVTSSDRSSGRQAMQLDVDQALQANSLLQTNSPSSLSEFSALSLRSGLPQLSEHIANLAASASTRQETVKNILARAILDMASNLAAAHQLLYEAEGRVGRLALTTARDRRHSEIELGFTDLDKLDLEQLVSDSPPRVGGQGTTAQTTVIDAKARSTDLKLHESTPAVEEVILLEDGTKGIETALSSKRLSWWKLPLGRADDVATDLAISLHTYFAGLERKLIFETGRLAERSLDLSLQVNTLLKSSPFARPSDKSKLSFYSATMENDIAALSPTTQFGFPPPSHPSAYNLSQTSLSAPIESRRNQLKAAGGAIERLQLRAQSCVVRFYSLSGVSTAAAVFLNQTSWLQIHQDVPFCVGLAGLGIATAAWRLQGGWKKSKSKFWTDWKRAQEGLAFDLQANAEDVLNHKVFVKADVACKVLKEHLAARKNALKDMEQRLRQAQKAVSP